MDVVVASTNVFRLELSAYLLAEAGYHVRECRDNGTLMQEVATVPPALLIIDQQMMQSATDCSLYTLAQQHHIPLLMLVTAAPGGQADDYVTWPYQPADLLARVRALRPLP